MSTHDDDPEALKAENTRLRARVEELEGELARERAVPYGALFEEMTIPAAIFKPDGTIIAVNRINCERFTTTADRLLGKYNALEDPQAVSLGYAEAFRRSLAGEVVAMAPGYYDTVEGMHDEVGRRIWSEVTYFPIRDASGDLFVANVSIDVTSRKEAEAHNIRLQEEMLRSRDEFIRAISAPLLPIAPGVLVMPIVGEVTRERAAQVLETLLEGVSTQQARITILDITGVPQAGEEITEALIRTARSVRLLGAEIVLTGIRPSVAQALVALNADLGGIVTLSTLERGVAYALARRDAR